MKKIILICFVVAGFSIAFFAGAASIDVPGIVLVRQIVTKKPIVVRPLRENTQVQVAQNNFQALKNDYLKRRLELLSKIDAQIKAVDFFKGETEKAEDEASLEASLVAEARYRNALTLLSERQDELITLYSLELNNAYSYLDFLNKPLQK